MTKLLLSLHVVAAVVAVGPVAVAASMFPRILRRAHAISDESATTLRVLHRICRVYAGVGMAVPVFGFATASSMGVLGDAWLIVSIVLTAVAAAVLILMVLPGQRAALDLIQVASPGETGAVDGIPPGAGLAMSAGVFNLLWVTVTILMIVRPGSSTGA
ncbi:hypothetical protein [Nonomuraea sp. bgisy101]|uniref:hypothetical protein n=1 Tax=Nonomuraea sp. bgisy101 TaxID=3413784 RepID=UPI003D70F058